MRIDTSLNLAHLAIGWWALNVECSMSPPRFFPLPASPFSGHSSFVKTFGLTGGIGMGKSTCADLLKQRGLHVIDTDVLAHDLVAPGQPALVEITSTFGSSVLDESGHLRRSALANLVFTDSEARRRLESILHPRIIKAWTIQLDRWRDEKAALAVVVIPLLFETGVETRFDTTVCVACTADTQKSRLHSRGWSDEEITRRCTAQLPVEEKMARATHVIWSEGSLESLAEQASRVFKNP
jgi:dephospho-CoA kinase